MAPPTRDLYQLVRVTRYLVLRNALTIQWECNILPSEVIYVSCNARTTPIELSLLSKNWTPEQDLIALRNSK